MLVVKLQRDTMFEEIKEMRKTFEAQNEEISKRLEAHSKKIREQLDELKRQLDDIYVHIKLEENHNLVCEVADRFGKNIVAKVLSKERRSELRSKTIKHLIKDDKDDVLTLAEKTLWETAKADLESKLLLFDPALPKGCSNIHLLLRVLKKMRSYRGWFYRPYRVFDTILPEKKDAISIVTKIMEENEPIVLLIIDEVIIT